jgi:hypothetical protein
MHRHPFLEVTYRKGKPFASYLYLREPSSEAPCRTEEVRPGVLVDVGSDGQALGIEFLAPGSVTREDVDAISRFLRGVRLPTDDLEPIMAR